ncbi:methyltransferase RsmF C-terminal domain-like protein [Sphingobacterium endophyticum]|uniref:methyltransferase RsmF C-terminal domain-like protein n=1 Tax=Sphingobacterium endophyticum TaxID=2546448 RepID=UPI0012E2E904|nr:RNA methyltransferase [Sphingobacterium endophyticum]
MSNILPNSLIERLGSNPFFDQEAFIAAHENGEKLTSIRINPNKKTNLAFKLERQVPWCREGYYLDERPRFTLDPLFHAGCYYVQEASSMFIAHILEFLNIANEDIRALDLCAAPGGKSTLLNSILTPNSLLVANEIIKSRSVILQENLMRWGSANVVVSNNDPSAFKRLPGFFDLAVVDAPCSGSGMFRKDEDSIDEWSEANVKLCRERQQRILSEVVGSISTNGTLLYSTCSYSREENEDILDWLIEEYGFESVQIPFKKDWGIEETISERNKAFGYRFYPHRTQGEGFFISVLKLKGIQPSFPLKKIKVEKSPVPKEGLSPWVNQIDNFSTLVHNENVHIFPKNLESSIKAIQQVLYLKNAGTMIGKWLGKELVPSHDLAMSIHHPKNIESLELKLEDAQDFLRKEQLDIELFSSVKIGWCLITYNEVALGWVKVLGNRINNYYPKEVRIANL